MVDLSKTISATQINFYSDASTAVSLGFGCVDNDRWIFAQWEQGFIEQYSPSISYLELYALCTGIFTWQSELRDCRIVVFCDNQGAVEMINNLTSNCEKCMKLIHMLVLNGLKYNRILSFCQIRGYQG